MIQSKTLVCYDWFDIEKEICNIMGIEKRQFRNYHSVVGGDYKDLWHVALETFIPDNMSNDSYVKLFRIEDEDFIEESEEWKKPFLRAYNKLMDEIDPDDNAVLVSFSW